MNQRIPEPIRPILESYVQSVCQHLPDLINAFYIVGSIALDGFNERFSDIDFVAVLHRKAMTGEIKKLRDIHKAIEKEFPRWKLSGDYFQVNDVGRSDHTIEPYPYYHDGKLHPEGRFEANLITWWILKNHGIAIIGIEPQDLNFTVDWDLLVNRMKENLNSYWVRWANRIDRHLVMLSDWGIQWAVSGVLRQYYTFTESSITTKGKAEEYALTSLPTRWHPLIQEAIDIREGHKQSAYRSRILRMREAVRLLKWVIQTCNARF